MAVCLYLGLTPEPPLHEVQALLDLQDGHLQGLGSLPDVRIRRAVAEKGLQLINPTAEFVGTLTRPKE